jgi:hypothetical protein
MTSNKQLRKLLRYSIRKVTGNLLDVRFLQPWLCRELSTEMWAVLSGRSSPKFIQLAACFLFVACLGYTSTLKREAVHFPTSLRHIPEDDSRYSHFVFRWKRYWYIHCPSSSRCLVRGHFSQSNCQNVSVTMPTWALNPFTPTSLFFLDILFLTATAYNFLDRHQKFPLLCSTQYNCINAKYGNLYN